MTDVARPRIQTLSDLIFGLALSISALTLIGQQPTSTQQLGFSLGLFAFSFLVLIQIWRFYSSLTSVLPAETPSLVELNIVLLFFVSIEPYLFNELFTLKGQMVQSLTGVYSIDLAAMLFILASFDHFLADERKHLVPRNLMQRFKTERNLTLLIASIFVISVIPYFGQAIVLTTNIGGTEFDLYIRNLFWIAGLILLWSWRLSKQAYQRKNLEAKIPESYELY